MRLKTSIFVFLLFLFAIPSLSDELKISLTDKGILLDEPIFGGKFYLEESGKPNRINVILCHGSGDLGATIWKDLIPDLEKQYHVFAFDLPGFTRSEKKNELYSPKNYARFIKWFIDTRVKGKVYLVGHSMGGAISLYFAGKYPKALKRLVLIDAAGILHRATFAKNILDSHLSRELKIGNKDLLEKPLSRLKYLINTTIEAFDSKFMPDNMNLLLKLSIFRKKVLDGDPIRISGMAMIHTDFSEIINQVKVPTYIIWGEKDPIAPIRTAKLLAVKIPETYLGVLPGLAHSPMLEHPDRFNDQLLEYLSDHPGERFRKATENRSISSSSKVKSYKDKKDLIIQGSFQRIELINCKNILIKNSGSRQIIIEDSDVKIENTVIKSERAGLSAINSIVQLTGVSISAKIAIYTSNSKLDIAGASLNGRDASLESDFSSTVVFSVSKVSSPYRDEYAHTVITLDKGAFY